MSKKVLMVGWELPPYNSGGLGVACLGLANALTQKGIEVTFVLPQKVDLNINNFKIIYANIEKDLKKVPSAYSSCIDSESLRVGSWPPDYARGALKYAEKIRQIAKKCNVDVIHAHDWFTFPAGVAAKEVLNKPLITHVHSTEYDRTGGNYPNPYVYSIEKYGLENADKVISVSQFTKDALVRNYGIDSNKINVVHNGIDLKGKKKNFPPALQSLKNLGYKIVLFLGRITLQKGPEYFVQAAKKVLDKDKKVIFVVAGSGDMQEQMMQEAGHLDMLDKMLFTGFVRGEEKDRIYQTADLYVMPSVSEPFGITPLEAISHGTPAIVSKQSGVSEVLDHVLKVDFWDVGDIADKILAVLEHRPLHEDLVDQSTKELPNINWGVSADKCIGIYNQLEI